jgi:hypothetical protein
MDKDNNNDFETVIIEGEVWAVTSPPAAAEDSMEIETDSAPGSDAADVAAAVADEGRTPGTETDRESEEPETTDEAEPEIDSAEADSAEAVDGSEADASMDEADFDSLRALTRLLVGGAIEGTSQLTLRLQQYQEDLRREAAESGTDGDDTAVVPEDELDRLRYAVVGLIFDAQATFRRNVTLWAKIASRSAGVTNRVTEPVANSFLFNPIQRRYDKLVRRGEQRLARWIANGRVEEPLGRQLASRTYGEIIDEFINRLSENPELQALITEQSLGVASEMRDEVRERTVTADNLMEGLVRRVLRRSPRAELPGPPPEVQKWAGLSIEEYKAQLQTDEDENEDASS